MRFAAVVAGLVAACGRLHFATVGTPLGGDGGGGGDGRPGANVVFLSSQLVDGGRGGLSGADATCNALAQQSGIGGSYVAWLSTSTINAVDRVAGSRGWVRADGLPVADTIAEMLAVDRMFNPIDVDENVQQVTLGVQHVVWTGSGPDGKLDVALGTCSDWTTSSATFTGAYGEYGAGAPVFTSAFNSSCNGQAHIYCFEVGRQFPITPPGRPANARVIFVGGARSGAGLANLDNACQNAAASAGLSGSFLAMVVTTTTTIASRFTADTRPIVRVDGTLVAASTSELFGTGPRSFVNQDASGLYSATAQPFVGAPGPNITGSAPSTCNNWNDVSATGTGGYGGPNRVDGSFWASGLQACNTAAPVMCLEN